MKTGEWLIVLLIIIGIICIVLPLLVRRGCGDRVRCIREGFDDVCQTTNDCQACKSYKSSCCSMASPTASPTETPTESPTESPTETPTTAPTDGSYTYPDDKPPDINDITVKQKKVDDCPSLYTYYKKNDPKDGDPIEFKMIAQGWKDAGMSRDYCPHFLRTLAGECAPVNVDNNTSCSYTPGGSGIMQLDSTKRFLVQPDRPSGYKLIDENEISKMNNNPCKTAILARDLFVKQPWLNYKTGTCEFTNIEGEKTTSDCVKYDNMDNTFITGPNNVCYYNENENAKPKPVNDKIKVQDWQTKYEGKTTDNFIGPFCHRGITNYAGYGDDGKGSKDPNNPTNNIWNGGGNKDQGPYRCYSDYKMLEYSGNINNVKGISDNCRNTSGASECTKAECDKIHDTAVKVAQGFCDQVY